MKTSADPATTAQASRTLAAEVFGSALAGQLAEAKYISDTNERTEKLSELLHQGVEQAGEGFEMLHRLHPLIEFLGGPAKAIAAVLHAL